MSSKPRLLWIGDAVVASGFARATHYVLDVLREDWDISVLGLNYQGDPHDLPYPVYPCWPGGDAFGLRRVKRLVAALNPDLVIVQNDPWNVPAYTELIPESVPVVAVCPVDGLNCRGEGLNTCKAVIFWTSFGLNEARRGGFKKPGYVIGLGVDREVYKPYPREQARAGLPEAMADGYIVGNVNRNQPRKRLDLTIDYFCTWVKDFNIPDAFLYLHVAPTGDAGYDCAQLMHYYGLKKRLALRVPHIGHGDSEADLALSYSVFDVQVNTGQGEGWGLTTLEGMACGVPQIVPDWAALSEWPGNTVVKVPCTTTAVTPNNVNVIGGIPDKDAFINMLHAVYDNPDHRLSYGERGLAHAARPEFSWRNIGEKFGATLQVIMAPEEASA